MYGKICGFIDDTFLNAEQLYSPKKKKEKAIERIILLWKADEGQVSLHYLISKKEKNGKYNTRRYHLEAEKVFI